MTSNHLEASQDAPEVNVRCGRCIGCRIDRSRTWAARGVFESQSHDSNEYVTLTYSDEAVPKNKTGIQTLKPKDMTDFVKRLRDHIKRDQNGPAIKYIACGEYGDISNRPHYHAIIFGLNLHDKKIYSTKGDYNLCSSSWLDSIWGHGNTIIGDVTFDSIAYVARYILKKKLGRESDYYKNFDIEPEFNRVSKGVGLKYFEKYKDQIYKADFIMPIPGVQMRPPRYFDLKYEKERDIREIKEKREQKQYENNPYPGWRRLDTRAKVLEYKLKTLKQRNLT